jgi:hypothetical protein
VIGTEASGSFPSAPHLLNTQNSAWLEHSSCERSLNRDSSSSFQKTTLRCHQTERVGCVFSRAKEPTPGSVLGAVWKPESPSQRHKTPIFDVSLQVAPRSSEPPRRTVPKQLRQRAGPR